MLFYLFGSAVAAPSYTVTAIPLVPGSVAAFGYGLNSRGDVAGYAVMLSGYEQAFVYSAGATVVLPTPEGSRSKALAINDTGGVVGFVGPSFSAVQSFFYSSSSGLVEIGGLGGRESIAHDINNAGVAVGGSSTSAGGYSAFEFQNGTISPLDLSEIGAQSSTADAINNVGQVAGSFYNGSIWQAFLQGPSSLIAFGAPGGNSTQAFGLNDLGDVVGTVWDEEGGTSAFLYSGGTFLDLGTIAGPGIPGYGTGRSPFSGATGINDQGTVVGSFGYAGVGGHAFVYSAGQMLDLNDYISSPDGFQWVITEAMAINDAGVILAYGYRPGIFISTPLLLTPSVVPEPPVHWLLVVAMLLLTGLTRGRVLRRLSRAS